VALNVQLEQVRKRSGGRIHLTVRVPKDGPVQTLCGKVFQPGDYDRTDSDADCSICLRRRSNEAIISSAFFNQDLGSELLKLSLQQARARPDRANRPARAAKKKPPPKLVVVPETEPERPQTLGELELRGLKKVSDTTYLSSSGAIVRIKRTADSFEVEEVVFNGPVQVRRIAADRLELKLGDLTAVISARGSRIEALYREDTDD
jgi:hypothetical protein